MDDNDVRVCSARYAFVYGGGGVVHRRMTEFCVRMRARARSNEEAFSKRTCRSRTYVCILTGRRRVIIVVVATGGNRIDRFDVNDKRNYAANVTAFKCLVHPPPSSTHARTRVVVAFRFRGNVSMHSPLPLVPYKPVRLFFVGC